MLLTVLTDSMSTESPRSTGQHLSLAQCQWPYFIHCWWRLSQTAKSVTTENGTYHSFLNNSIQRQSHCLLLAGSVVLWFSVVVLVMDILTSSFNVHKFYQQQQAKLAYIGLTCAGIKGVGLHHVCWLCSGLAVFIMASLCNRQAIIFLPCGFFFFFLSMFCLFSSPKSLISAIAD